MMSFEEKDLVVLGVDFSTIPLIRELCLYGYKNLMTIDQSIEPGVYTGTYRSGGFSVEKFYILLERGIAKDFSKIDAEVACVKPRIRVAKEGDLRRKTACWRNVDPWWLPKDLDEICMIRNSGDYVKNRVLAGCAEYTFYTPRKIDLDHKIVFLRNGRILRYKKLIASYPLNKILDILRGDEISIETRQDLLRRLRWTGVLSVSLGVKGSSTEDQMVFHGTRASRTYMFLNISNMFEDVAPKDHYLLNLQMSFCEEYPPPPDAYSRAVAEARWARLYSDDKEIVLERSFVISHLLPYNIDEKISDEIRYHLMSKDLYLIGVRGRALPLSISDQLREYEKIFSEIIS